ncbi:MAG: PAS domain S-box protein [Pseudomonadota bacterium]
MNCWEVKKCGRIPGGRQVEELGLCPAWPHHGHDCFLIAGACAASESPELGQARCRACEHYQGIQVSLHSERLSRNLVDLCPICIVGVNRQGTITLFNRAAEALLGAETGAVVGKRAVTDFYADPAEPRRVKKTMHSDQFGPPGRVEGMQLQMQAVDGDGRPVRLWGFLHLEQGQEIGSVGFFYDLRPERLVEQERLAQEKMASVLQLAGALLHNLAQPLQVLLADSGLLLGETGEDGPALESLRAINTSARQIGQILDKIRKLSSLKTTRYSGGNQILDLDQDKEQK